VNHTSLELLWPGKNDSTSIAPCRLIEDAALSYQSPGPALSGNLLIHGDNLCALTAIQKDFAGRIQCIYIDPPYNSGTVQAHYDDSLDHAAWLTMMRQRLELMRGLLAATGVLLVSIDDVECAYLSVLLDELFGRSNRCGTFIWERKKKPSFLDGSMAVVTEYVLAYARDRASAPEFVGGQTTSNKKYPLNNAGNGLRTLSFAAGAVLFRCPDQVFAPQDMSQGRIITRLLDAFEVRQGRNLEAFRLEGEWRYSQAKLDELLAAGQTIVISKAPFRPNHIKTATKPKKLRNLLSISHGMATNEDATEESRQLFGAQAFAYPKPEKLLATLIGAVTQKGDWVLDAFAGSGTTGAVAHKLGRRWIMIESQDHCTTHIPPRLRKVIDNSDPGGVTSSSQWSGGGGYRFLRCCPAF